LSSSRLHRGIKLIVRKDENNKKTPCKLKNPKSIEWDNEILTVHFKLIFHILLQVNRTFICFQEFEIEKVKSLVLVPSTVPLVFMYKIFMCPWSKQN